MLNEYTLRQLTRSRFEIATAVAYCATGPTGRINRVGSSRALCVRISSTMERANSSSSAARSGTSRNGTRARRRNSATGRRVRLTISSFDMMKRDATERGICLRLQSIISCSENFSRNAWILRVSDADGALRAARPTMQTDILISEQITGAAVSQLSHDFAVVALPEIWRSQDKLLAAVANCRALMVRNQTRVTAELIAAAPRLEVIGRAGAGLDNVDLA